MSSIFFFFFFFLRYHSVATEEKFSRLTLHRLHQGALPLDGCRHGTGFFLCSELRFVAVFAANKIQTWHVSLSTANSKVPFYVSLCEIICIEIQI